MGDSWANEPVEIIPGVPEDVAGIRSALINTIMNGHNLGASHYGRNIPHTDAAGRTQYSFQPYRLNAGTDPQQLSATNILSGLAGTPSYVPATDNLYAHPEWGFMNFTPDLPGDGGGGGDGRERDPRRRSIPPPDPPDYGNGGGGGGIPGGRNGGVGGGDGILDPDEVSTRQRLMMMNLARRGRQLGV